MGRAEGDKQNIPLVDLSASLAPIRRELMAEIEAIFDRMDLFLGTNQRAFESEFTACCEARYGIAVSNGTDALLAALRGLDIGPGDEVIAPSMTFFATIEAILHVGATPVLVDVEPDALGIDVERVESAVTPATRAILPVHLYGHPAAMSPILEIARQHDLRVIEDAAQAHGARYDGKRCGGLGDAAAFSFYFTKNLGALGEAGFVTARDEALAEKIRLLRHHGHVSKFEHAIAGYNLRMDEIQAAVLRLKLRGLEDANRRRRAIAARYDALFADYPIRPLIPRKDCEPVYHLYPIRVADRDALRDWLEERGVGTGIHYPIAAHRQPAARRAGCRFDAMEVTERACAELLSIPVYPELDDEQVEYVAAQVRTFFEQSHRAAPVGSA
jgi:dTDP-4-amino-4,6-dideoxygalactose transaminase